MFLRFNHTEVLQRWRRFAAQTAVPMDLIRRFLYIHAPYCARKCAFCMYESETVRSKAQIRERAEALVSEMEATAQAVDLMDFDGMYFGGGTPSLFPEREFARILSAARRVFSFTNRAVSTCEMHPHSATREKIAIAVHNGMRRISLGVQSLTPSVLRRVRRIPVDKQHIAELVAFSGKTGEAQVNIDLLAPLPGETLGSFLESLKHVLDCGPDSVVLYFLQDFRKIYDSSSVSSDDLIHIPWRELCSIFYQTARASGYRVLPGTSNLVTAAIVCKDIGRYNQENRYELYSRTPVSVLGIGKYAKSHIFGQLEYVNTGPDIAKGIHTENIYEGSEKTIFDEALNMVFLHIRDRVPMDLSLFERIFGIAAPVFLEDHFNILFERGHVQIKEGQFVCKMNFLNESKFWQFRDLMMQKIYRAIINAGRTGCGEPCA